jgi:serine/threonine protein kinase/WD40 repeat protein
MIQRGDPENDAHDGEEPFENLDDDERVGEAIETYLALAEKGQAPAIDDFVAGYPDLEEDVRSALEGLELVHGLLGLRSAGGSGSGHGSAWDHRIESGQRIAGYRVVRELGRGGMGTVFEAVHMGLDRPVALKVLGVHATPDSTARRRFLNEARTAAGLHHTHIVPVFDVGQVGGLCYYAMQRIEGSGLDRVVRHLRRSRPAGSAAGQSGSGLLARRARATQSPDTTPRGILSPGSRLGRFWSQVRTRPVAHSVESAATNLTIGPPPRPADNHHETVERLLSLSGSLDATASWIDGQRRGTEETRDLGMPGSPAHGAPRTAIPRDPNRHDLEPPPFETPRGSAYFRWVATVGQQAADALAHAHQQGVIHRDVKPSNLLVDAKGNIWVTDFGLARRLADPGQTHHDSLLGTPRYMSPEQARTGSIDGRTDVYSLGATLYELLTLRPPFNGESAAELLDQIGQDDPLHPRSLDPRIPLDLETIVLKALAKRPADRYKTAGDLADDLGRFLNHEPVKARRISPLGRLWRVARRHPGITSVTTAASIAILSIATYAYVRVLAERDLNRKGQLVAEHAVEELRRANEQTKSEIKERLVKQVELLEKSDFPDRRRQGLELIEEIVALGPDATQRSSLSDLAMKFQVLRQVESRGAELQTGRASSLAFGPRGHRLAVLSDDQEDLALWDVSRRQKSLTLSLHGDMGVALPPQVNRGASEATSDAGQGPLAAAALGLSAGRSSTTPAPARSPLLDPRGLAATEQYLAVIFADRSGVRLIDPATGGTLRTLHRPDRAQVLSVIADSSGQRLITIERVLPDEIVAMLDPSYDVMDNPGEFQVNLWDPDNLDKPRTLRWTGLPPRGPGGPNAPQPASRPPLVAISPEAKTVAIAPVRGGAVSFFSGEDGRPLGGNGRNFRMETQPELTALALGPNMLLATAGGGVIRLWNLDRESRAAHTELNPAQSLTRKLQFSPRGNLLAIVGLGPIELWDPVAHALVGVLKTSEQISDLTFAPDGQTLAVVDRGGMTSLWSVTDSAIRTQLSGIESRPSSLAFSKDGTLACGGWNGAVWYWRPGRCPEVGSPLVLSTPARDEPSASQLSRPSPPSAGAGNGSRTGGGASTAPPSAASASSATEPGRNAAPTGPPTRGRGGPPNMGGRPREADRDPRPTFIAFDSDGRLVVHDIKNLRVWPAGPLSALTAPAVQNALPAPVKRPWANLVPMARSADGQTMALARSSSVFLWRGNEAIQVIPMSRHSSGDEERAPVTAGPANRSAGTSADGALPIFHAVRVSPSGDRIYLLDQTGHLHVWTVDPERDRTVEPPVLHAKDVVWEIPVPEEGFSNLSLRNDGAVLALADHTQTVSILDAASHKIIGRLKPSAGQADSPWLAMQFAPYGHDIAVGSDQGIISIWSVENRARPRLRYRLPGHRGMTSSLAYDTEGRRLASAGMDPIIEVWDLERIQQALAKLQLAN